MVVPGDEDLLDQLRINLVRTASVPLRSGLGAGAWSAVAAATVALFACMNLDPTPDRGCVL